MLWSRVMRRLVLLFAVLSLFAVYRAGAQTEPEAPREPEVLYNGYQFSFFGGGNLTYLNGYYNGLCPCEFVGDITDYNLFYGAAINIPLFSDASLYLRLSHNRSSSNWFTGRSDSLRSVPALGLVGSDLTFDYDVLSFDVLLRLFGRIDGERVYIGPSFGFVREKNIRITDTELRTGAVYLIEDDALALDHRMRMSFIIGAEYAFVPLKDLYVIPSFEIDYSFSKLENERSARPNFSMKPTFYRFFVTIAYQVF